MCGFNGKHGLDFLYRDTVPFDWYGFDANAFVIEKATNKSVPIVAFAASEGPNNFIVYSTSGHTKSRFTYDSGTGPTTLLVDSSVVSVQVKRSPITRAFTLCLLVVNWALTVGSVYITLLALVGTGKKDPAVVLLPVTLVLTIPTLRGLYVGSPPFGVYIGEYRVVSSWLLGLTSFPDTFGFFLQMVIIVVSSMILLHRVAL